MRKYSIAYLSISLPPWALFHVSSPNFGAQFTETPVSPALILSTSLLFLEPIFSFSDFPPTPVFQMASVPAAGGAF